MVSNSDMVYLGDIQSPSVKESLELIGKNYDKIRADLARFSADTRWVTDNYEALKKDYGDMYVAVLDKKVRASHANLTKLLEEIDEKGIDRINVHIERIYKQDVALMF